MTKITQTEELQQFNRSVTDLLYKLNRTLDVILADNNLDKLDVVDLVTLQQYIRTNLDDVKRVESTLGKVHDMLRKNKVPERMLDSDVRGISVEGVGRVSLVDDMYASIKKEKQTEALTWLDDRGHGEHIKTTINAQSLKKLLKDKIKEGEVVPEDIFSVTPYTYAKITGEKKKDQEANIF